MSKVWSYCASLCSASGSLEHAGVVDQDVDLAELRLDGVEHGVHFLGAGHVGLDGEGTAAGGLQLGDEGIGLLRARCVVDGDGEAVPGEALRDGGSDAARCAGDDGDLGSG